MGYHYPGQKPKSTSKMSVLLIISGMLVWLFGIINIVVLISIAFSIEDKSVRTLLAGVLLSNVPLLFIVTLAGGSLLLGIGTLLQGNKDLNTQVDNIVSTRQDASLNDANNGYPPTPVNNQDSQNRSLRVCPYCKQQQSSNKRYCIRCGRPL